VLLGNKNIQIKQLLLLRIIIIIKINQKSKCLTCQIIKSVQYSKLHINNKDMITQSKYGDKEVVYLFCNIVLCFHAIVSMLYRLAWLSAQ